MHEVEGVLHWTLFWGHPEKAVMVHMFGYS